jgi:protein O-GlcNAc transferase
MRTRVPDSGDSVDAELARGLADQQQGRLAEAERAYANVLAQQPNHADALHLLGIVALQTGQPERAATLIGRAIEHDASVPAAHNNLGIALRRLGRTAEAVASFDRAIALRPDDAEAHNNRGVALREAGRLREALSSYDRAIASLPRYAEAHNNRGILLRAAGHPIEALDSYDRAIALRPDDAGVHANRGNALLDLLRFADALASYDRAIALRPDHAEAHADRANVLVILDRAAEALVSCDTALALAQDRAATHAVRGNALTLLRRPDDARQSYDRAIALDPSDAGAYYSRGELLRSDGLPDEAVAALDAALAVDPLHGAARLARCMAELPIVPHSEAEIATRRARYLAALQRLAADAEDPAVRRSLVHEIGVPAFYLPYQGENDVVPQRAFGRLAPRPGGREKIRLGLVSGFFCAHTVYRLFLDGWLSELDRDRFEITGFHTSRADDAATARLAGLCGRFVRDLPSKAAWRGAVIEAAPHVLLYPEFGMDAISGWLAAQRLAPVQCVTWGHPETTGLPEMDYFLSSDLMEPPDGEQHYSERLVRLPGLALHYTPDETLPEPVDREAFGLRADQTRPEPIDRAAFGLHPEQPVFWSGQSLFKYLPRHDWIFPAIAAASGPCQFVFVSAMTDALTDIFRDRLRRAFAERGMDADRYCVILPKLSQQQYVCLAGLADVILDPPDWSGGRSTLDCLAVGPAIVTLPGRFMRGRHTAAILRQIGCEETIARSAEDYVAIAARLVRDAAWRDRVKQAVSERKHLAYRDARYVPALETFLQQAVDR